MKMLCLTKYTRLGSSSRYRLYQFAPYLEKEGIELTIQPLLDDRYLLRMFAGKKPSYSYLVDRFLRRVGRLFSTGRHDLVFIEREMFPHLPGFAETLLHKSGAKMVLDIDDAVFLLHETAPTSFERALLKDKLPKIMRRCALVTVGNNYLRDYAGRYTKNVALFPTVVDADQFTPRGDDIPRGVPVLGWMGSPVTSKYMSEIIPVLERLAGQHEFAVTLVGADPMKINGVNVMTKPWTEDEEAQDLRTFDIGLMPLDVSEWSLGKCALKLLQYMSAGLPTVSSAHGAAADIIEDGLNGFLAANSDEWEEKIKRLLDTPRLRASMGRQARQWIEDNYSLANYGPRLARTLKELGMGGAK